MSTPTEVFTGYGCYATYEEELRELEARRVTAEAVFLKQIRSLEAECDSLKAQVKAMTVEREQNRLDREMTTVKKILNRLGYLSGYAPSSIKVSDER